MVGSSAGLFLVFGRLAAACVLLVLLAGCGGGVGGSPTSVARSYEKAIMSKDGDTLCATFAPKMREVVGEQITLENTAAGSRGLHYDCGAYYHLLIGYPHENTDKQFVAGKLLGVGSSRQVRREGVLYMKVPAKVRLDYVYTGYTSNRNGEKGTTTLIDTVWLAKGKNGKWGVVKPSLALVAAAGSPDVLDESYRVARVTAPPPDPDYSMNRAERTAWEAADYKASFRRSVGHSAFRCPGKSVSVTDPRGDAVTYPSGSALSPVPAPNGNDIKQVTVQVAGHTVCVAVTFRRKPTGHLSIGFTPRFPTYIVELVPSLGARGGVLTAGYRYFRGGEQLRQKAVKEISLYGNTVAFVADTNIVRSTSPLPRSTDFYWQVRSSARTGMDQVPNQSQGDYLVIRQSDGHVVTPPRG